eukprot:g1274.t1
MSDDDVASNRAFLQAEELGANKALLQAVSRGAVLEVAALLDNHGADMSTVGLPGTSCAGCAAMGGHVRMLRFLEERGAPLDVPDYGGATPLMEACRHGHVEAAQWLVDRGARTGIQDVNGWTLAHVVAVGGQLVVAHLLKGWGVPLGLPDSDGKPPSEWATDTAIKRLLLAAESDAQEQKDYDRREGDGKDGEGGGAMCRAKSVAPSSEGGDAGGRGDAVAAAVDWSIEILDDESGTWHPGVITRYTERTNMARLSVPGAALEGDVPLDLDFINLCHCRDGASRPLFDLVQHKYRGGDRRQETRTEMTD